VAFGIIRQLLFEIVDELRPFGRGPTKLISPFSTLQSGARRSQLADDSADARDPRIVLFRPHGLAGDSASCRIERSFTMSKP
jgi:hypothetical protein